MMERTYEIEEVGVYMSFEAFYGIYPSATCESQVEHLQLHFFSISELNTMQACE